MSEPTDPQDVRRRAFVAAARALFFTDGYGATSMSRVAARVGGSKTTLWAYYPSKAALFAAVVDGLVEEFGQALETPLDPALPVRAALEHFGHGMVDAILAPEILELHRIVAGEAGRFPELGTLFYDRGPRRGKDKLATFLAAAMADGRLRRGDPLVAARQFVGMCQSGTHQLRLFALTAEQCAEQVRAEVLSDVAHAVDTFMRGWAAPA